MRAAERAGRPGEGSSGYVVHSVAPLGLYIGVFVALLAFTGATVGVAFLDLGTWGFLHTPLALGIATAKALLVALFFMHLRDSERLTWAVVVASLLWLGLLLFLTMGDYVTRDRDAADLEAGTARSLLGVAAFSSLESAQSAPRRAKTALPAGAMRVADSPPQAAGRGPGNGSWPAFPAVFRRHRCPALPDPPGMARPLLHEAADVDGAITARATWPALSGTAGAGPAARK